ncbi:PilZ domain-containing protein [Hyalangium gracile]|uniref:PilZ domain-containing protein n=1 Tax=Hyalangium gracile TaxID=394092 RepID=UPI001CCD0E3A|nr:PilZ domain-containing protein [Hyalangium gracile]
MSFDSERRRHPRYPLRLAIKLHYGRELLDADIINASASGVLILCATPLEPGGVVEASIPELMIPRTTLHILRCHAVPMGYMVAAYFEAVISDEAPFARLAEEQGASLAHLRWLN